MQINAKTKLTLAVITILTSNIANGEIYKCRKSDGSIEFSDTGCDSDKFIEKKFEDYKPRSRTDVNKIATPNQAYNAEAESAVKDLGFRSFNHYMDSRSICLRLLEKTPLLSGNISCGTDMQCLKRQAQDTQRRYKNLSSSSTWINNKCDVVMRVESRASSRNKHDSYRIEVAHNDELFIINGEEFEARTYCYNMREGDQVIFLEGSALGACASATVLNLRSKDKCELWCE